MSEDETDERSWAEYRRLILAELVRIDSGLAALNQKMDTSLMSRDVKFDTALATRDQQISDLRVEVGMQKVKSGMIGGLTGLAATMAAILLQRLGTH